MADSTNYSYINTQEPSYLTAPTTSGTYITSYPQMLQQKPISQDKTSFAVSTYGDVSYLDLNLTRSGTTTQDLIREAAKLLSGYLEQL
jgi:hypothetical protein